MCCFDKIPPVIVVVVVVEVVLVVAVVVILSETVLSCIYVFRFAFRCEGCCCCSSNSSTSYCCCSCGCVLCKRLWVCKVGKCVRIYVCVCVLGGGGVVSCSVSVPVLLFIQYNIELRVSLCRRRYACVFFCKTHPASY